MVNITDADFDSEVIDSGGVVMVFFSKADCAPCRQMTRVVDKFESDYTQIKFVKIDTYHSQLKAEEYDVVSLPTFIIFNNSQPAVKITGAVAPSRMEAELLKFVKS